MKTISRRIDRSMRRPSAKPAQIIEGQWRECAKPAEPKPTKIPPAAWMVPASCTLFQCALIVVVNSHVAPDNAIWFVGGMLMGTLVSGFAIGLFCHWVFSANRQS